jgi:hypothetical protein
MKHVRWIGVPMAGALVAAGVLSVAAAPFASAAPVLTSVGVAELGGVSGTSSSNWSGYADTQTGAYTYVSANWTEPSYKCDGHSPESAAIWVGIDGYASKTVEQGGTIAICHGTKQGTHKAWWEMYPTNAVQEVFSVKVGDKMFASVTYGSGGTPYDIVVKDLTSGASLNMHEACGSTPCVRSSAEWIVETPYFSPGGTAYLPKFIKAIKFTAGVASQAPNGANPVTIASFTHVSITLTNSTFTSIRALPSALSSTGKAFSVKWVSSAP